MAGAPELSGKWIFKETLEEDFFFFLKDMMANLVHWDMEEVK